MKFNCAYTELVEIHKLQPNPKNMNKHPEKQIDMLAKIIDYQGQRSPIVVSKRSGFITKGHGRLMAIQKLGWTQAAVDFQDYESEAQEYADIVADNKIAELADFDDAMMIEELRMNDALKDLDFDLLGLPDFELPTEPDPAKELIEDNIPENVETRCKPGDLWILGEHRLLCGDSTNIQHVERLMGGEKAKLLHTDPPYGVDYEGVNNDHLKGEKLRDFIRSALSSANAVMEPGACYYIWHSDIHAYEFIGAIRDNGWKQARPSVIQWVKDSLVFSQGDYHSRNEPCLYGWKDGAGHKRVEDRKQDTIWEFPKPRKADGHPTMKPVELCQRAIINSSEKKWEVLDLFGGSGSTLIACEKTNRKCFMMELDPHYCDVILKRWEDYSGKKATLSQS